MEETLYIHIKNPSKNRAKGIFIAMLARLGLKAAYAEFIIGNREDMEAAGKNLRRSITSFPPTIDDGFLFEVDRNIVEDLRVAIEEDMLGHPEKYEFIEILTMDEARAKEIDDA